MIGDDLYKRGYDQPLLKCVTAEQAQYIIKELHERICGYHSGARTMATRVLRAGDNAVVDAIKLILLIYNNFSIIKKVVNKIERVK